MQSNPAIWTDEVRAFVRENHRGISNKDLAALVNNHFDTTFTERQMESFRKNHKLQSGLDGRFKPGHVPFCKGRKMVDYMTPEAIERTKATRFQPGSKPHNYMPVGSEVIKSDGYWWRKIAEPNRWRQLHRILWEEAHGRPVPKGHYVIFLDMDRMNLAIDNLRLVTTQEHRTLNQQGLRTRDKELTEISITVAKLHEKIYDRTVREEKEESYGNEEHIVGSE